MIPKTRIEFFGQFFVFSSLCSLWKVSFRIAMNFFSGHFGEEGGRFISQNPLKQVFSAPLLSGFLWVFWVVPTLFIWVFMWILIISCKKSVYFTFCVRILHSNFYMFTRWKFISQKSLKLGVQYTSTRRELYRLLTTDYENSHKKWYENSWCNSENSEGPSQWCYWKYLF